MVKALIGITLILAVILFVLHRSGAEFQWCDEQANVTRCYLGIRTSIPVTNGSFGLDAVASQYGCGKLTTCWCDNANLGCFKGVKLLLTNERFLFAPGVNP